MTPDGSPFDQVQAFFDHWLRGDQNGVAALAARAALRHRAQRVAAGRRVAAVLGGADEPLPARPRARRAAAGDGVLSPAVPDDEPQDTYVYDPADPVTYWLGRDLWGLAGQLDDRSRWSAGRTSSSTARTSCPPTWRSWDRCRWSCAHRRRAPDTDFTAALVDVYPDGFAQLVQEGVLRARFRESPSEERFLEPGEPAAPARSTSGRPATSSEPATGSGWRSPAATSAAGTATSTPAGRWAWTPRASAAVNSDLPRPCSPVAADPAGRRRGARPRMTPGRAWMETKRTRREATRQRTEETDAAAHARGWTRVRRT